MLIKSFKDISKDDAKIAGGKGASLGEMTQAGIPVPPGYVILSDAFDKFISGAGLKQNIDEIIASVDIDIEGSANDASRKIQTMILKAEMPNDINIEIKKSFAELNTKYVAVRSSATAEDSAVAAWAGQLDSFLNTTQATLLENVKKCWASLFTPRAIFYRFEKKLNAEFISVAVVVQKMVNSEVSGIAFSVHPVTQDLNQIIIEAGFGLGEAIVSGSITPDSYVIGKKELEIQDVMISEQTKALYRVDAGGNEWQELGEKGKDQVLDEDEVIQLAKLIIRIEEHYGFPCDIEWAKEGGELFIVQSRPITTLQSTQKNEKVIEKYILGNQDVDTSFVTVEMTWSGMEHDDVGKHAGLPPCKSFAEIIKGSILNYYVEADKIVDFVNASSSSLIDGKELLEELRQGTIESTQAVRDLAEKHLDHVAELDDEKLIEVLMETKRLQAQATTYGVIVAFADIFGTITNRLMEIISSREELKYSVSTYSHILGSPAKKSLTEKAYADIHASNNSDEVLLRRYFWLDQGYIGRGLTKEQLQSIKDHAQPEDSEHTQEELVKELKLSDQEERYFEVSRALIELKSLRADSRQYLHVLTNHIVDMLAQRFDVDVKLFEAMCADEICESIKSGVLPNNLDKRWEHSIVQKTGSPYDYLYDNDVEEFLAARLQKDEIEDKTMVKGQVAQPGKVTGKVKLVFGPQHNNKVAEGEILISRATSPQLLPAMKRAAAFVTDMGGITSHAAIVSREMKKPCVVGTKYATEIFSDGDVVEVDADEGAVKLVEKAQ
jgi:phosphohistidine swiveling domain-containing protein